MLDINSVAAFSWAFNELYLVQPLGTKDLYLWSNPEYPNGNNTIKKLATPYPSSLAEWQALYRTHLGIDFVRDKGTHLISRYCGDTVQILPATPG